MSPDDTSVSDDRWGQELGEYRQAHNLDVVDNVGDVDIPALTGDNDDVFADSDRIAAPPDDEHTPAVSQRFDHKLLLGFGGAVAAAAVAAIAGAVMFYSPDTAPSPPRTGALTEPQAVAAAKPTPTSAARDAGPGVNQPLPYTADARGSCAAGSTPAQTMFGADPHNAFVCVRAGGDGQVIDLDLGHTVVVDAICLTPGWVGQDGGGLSPWSQHRVVSRAQYSFPDDPSIPIVTQDTHNVHGEDCQQIKHVLASRIRMLIRYTSRPPVDPVTAPHTSAPGAFPNLFGDQAPGVAAPQQPGAQFGRDTADGTDPVDATFAISLLKIIGHKAV